MVAIANYLLPFTFHAAQIGDSFSIAPLPISYKKSMPILYYNVKKVKPICQDTDNVPFIFLGQNVFGKKG